jgi:tRNA 2-thiocytidine biosynthesis protein TtcA
MKTLPPSSSKGRQTPLKRISRWTSHAIRDYRMIQDGDRILVGVSGGADSMVLMHVLHHLQRRAPIRFTVFGVTVDMQFATMNIPVLREYCAEQGWHHEVVEFAGEEVLAEKGMGGKPCSLCSRLRRGLLHGAADRLGCNKIALGQHRDDLCASMLMSLFRGGGVKTMGVHVLADAGSKRLVRPLCYAPKAVINQAAADLGIPAVKGCPYLDELEKDGDRAFVERLLADLEGRFRDLRQCMLTSMKHVDPDHLLDPSRLDFPSLLRNSAAAPPPEPDCGEPGRSALR